MKNIFNKFFLLCLMMTGLLLSCTGPKEEHPETQKTATGISISSKPTKTTYTIGENFDRTGLKVLLVYSDNTTQDVTARVEIEGFSSSAAGDCTITVFYADEANYFEETFTVTIIAKSGSGDDPEDIKEEDDIPGLLYISVATMPDKIVYYDDDTELDPTGLVVNATFSDPSKSGPVTNYNLSGFDSEAQYGKKTITVTYTSAGVSKEATFQITVKAVALSKIEVKSKPSKIYYELNENFSVEGMVVIATFNNGKVKEITDYTISEFDSSKIATVPITVSYLYKSPAYENDMKDSDNYTEEYVDYIKSLYTKTDTFDAYVKYMDASYTFTEKVTAMPAGTDGSAGTNATYVLFGDMPQTIKAKDVVVNTIAEENGYYLASDGNYYAKVLENATQTVTIFSDGGTSSGGYDDTKTKELNITYSDGTRANTEDCKTYAYFKVEPVKWRVASSNYNNKGKYLLVSEKILDSGFSYYNVRQSRWINNKWVYASNYEYSTVRNYLNGLSNFEGRGLVDQLFTEKSKALVCDTEVVNDGESTQDHAKQKLKPADGTVQNDYYEYVDYTCANTNDKLFLLSVNELTNPDYGFADTPELHLNDNYSDQDTRMREGTDYALANSLVYDLEECGNKSGNWWSRSPAESSSLPNGIKESEKDQNTYINIYLITAGSGNVFYMNAFNSVYGIVPALCVDSL